MVRLRSGRDVSSVTKDPDLEALGQAIRHLRAELGISQEELAHRAKLSANYLSDLERGTRNVGAKALYKIARGLDTSPASFFIDIAVTEKPGVKGGTER